MKHFRNYITAVFLITFFIGFKSGYHWRKHEPVPKRVGLSVPKNGLYYLPAGSFDSARFKHDSIELFKPDGSTITITPDFNSHPENPPFEIKAGSLWDMENIESVETTDDSTFWHSKHGKRRRITKKQSDSIILSWELIKLKRAI
ncbi:MAG TPA: hypothetical protein VK666_26970 [Chryseolinea sp.]|nr:hypothetical protein [Chryseolinea sp.]